MINTRHLYLLLFALFSLLFFATAGAQSMGDMVTYQDLQNASLGPPESKSMRFMKGIFGDQFASINPFSAVGGHATLLGHIVFLFNSVLFILVVPMLIYQVVMLITLSANDGEVLGKSAKPGDGVTMPIRLGVGVFGLLPVLGGFSIAQGAMMLAIVMGDGAANMLAKVAVEKTAQMEPFLPSVAVAEKVGAHNSGIEDLAQGLLIANACQIAQEYKARAVWNEQGQLQLLPLDQAARHQTVSVFDERHTRGLDFGNCGRVSISKPKKSDLRLNEGVQAKLGFRIQAVNYEEIANAVNNAAYSELITLDADIRTIIENWMQQYWGSNASVNDMYTLISQYNEIVDSAKIRLRENITTHSQNKAAGIQPQLKENILADGWIGLGAWTSVFGEVNAAIASAQNAYHYEFTPGTRIDRILDNNRGEFYSVENLAAMLMDHFYTHQENREGVEQFGECFFDYSQTASGECSIGQNLAGLIISFVSEDSGGAGLTNPITVAKNMGDYMMVLGQVTAGGAQAVRVFGGKTPVGAGIKKMASALGGGKLVGMATTFGLFMIALGMYLSVFVPLHMFIGWFGAITNWFAAMCQAILMAQIWAFTHINPRSDGVVDGPQEKGYKYWLHMLLKPSLHVIGLVMGMIVIVYCGTLLNSMFMTAFSAAQGNSATGPMTIIGVVAVYCIMLFGLIATGVSVMVELPDTLLGWIGVQDTTRGLTGGAIAGATAGTAIAQTKFGGGGSGGAVVQQAAKSTNTGSTGFSARTS